MLPLRIMVATLSVVAMVVDPLPTRPVQLALRGATLFLGGSIHDLAQWWARATCSGLQRSPRWASRRASPGWHAPAGAHVR